MKSKEGREWTQGWTQPGGCSESCAASSVLIRAPVPGRVLSSQQQRGAGSEPRHGALPARGPSWRSARALLPTRLSARHARGCPQGPLKDGCGLGFMCVTEAIVSYGHSEATTRLRQELALSIARGWQEGSLT